MNQKGRRSRRAGTVHSAVARPAIGARAFQALPQYRAGAVKRFIQKF
jgi:hypothetical protein